MELSGILVPATTPFSGGEVATDLLAENLAAYRDAGVCGVLVAGSTGEAAFLEDDERVALVAAARRSTSMPVVAGVGLEGTRSTCRMARRAADAGADAVLVLTPFFFRGRMDEEALAAHFEAVADASPVPVLLYNVPMYTGIVIPPSVVARLAAHHNVGGLKDSSGDVGWLLEVGARLSRPFTMLCGSAAAVLPELAAGAAGAILAAADVIPEPFVRLYELHVAGAGEEALALARRLASASRILVGRGGVAGVKAGMDLRGLRGGEPRPPLRPPNGEAREAIRREIQALVDEGVLPAAKLR